MITDIVRYTSLMGEDEEPAYELFRMNRESQRFLMGRHGGKWLEEINWNFLVYF